MAQSEPESTDERTIKSVATACRIIDALVELNGAGVTELAEHLDLSKGGVHTHLATLQDHELAVKTGETYRPSFRFLEVGEYVRREQGLISIARPELDNLAETTGDRSHLVIEEHGRSVLVYTAAGSNALASTSFVGRRRLLHSTASGKAILAHLPRSRVDEIIDQHGLPRYTKNTITEPDELYEELATIRERGVSYNCSEKVAGLQAIGAPILDSDDAVIGSISVTAPLSEISGESGTELSELVKNTANIIEVNNQIQSQQSGL